MADIFISYKSRMRPRVREIAAALEELGLSVWFDAELEAGKSFAAVINKELATARCVVVCWTPDAFAPEDGSEVSWVEAEASIARERKVIVPVMLERVPLKAPWNMFHTERLMDWPAGKQDHPVWQALLEAIGRNVGRPGLAEYALALSDPKALTAWSQKYPEDPHSSAAATPVAADPALAAKRMVRRAQQMPVALRWMLGATVLNTIAAILLLLRAGPDATGLASYAVTLGPIASSAVFAAALWRAGTLDLGRALFSIVAGAIGYVAAIFTSTLIEPAKIVLGVSGDMATGAINGFLAGGLGAFVALGGIALLIGNVDRERWLKLALGSLALAVLCGVLGTGPLHGIYPSNFFWISIFWTFCYGLLLTRLALGRPAHRG